MSWLTDVNLVIVKCSAVEKVTTHPLMLLDRRSQSDSPCKPGRRQTGSPREVGRFHTGCCPLSRTCYGPRYRQTATGKTSCWMCSGVGNYPALSDFINPVPVKLPCKSGRRHTVGPCESERVLLPDSYPSVEPVVLRSQRTAIEKVFMNMCLPWP